MHSNVVLEPLNLNCQAYIGAVGVFQLPSFFYIHYLVLYEQLPAVEMLQLLTLFYIHYLYLYEHISAVEVIQLLTNFILDPLLSLVRTHICCRSVTISTAVSFLI